jgi:hypothetical protein
MRITKAVRLMIIVAGVLHSPAINGQNRILPAQITQPNDSPEARALAAIKRKRPEITDQILARDLVMVNNSTPAIANSLERWSATEVQRAKLEAWQEVRLNSPLGSHQAMNSAAFIEFVTEHIGFILFESDPDEANVFLGEERLGSTSKEASRSLHRSFPEGESKTVTFSKPQFVSETKTCTAVARDTVRCSVILNPVPKKP